jgi:hypothetical protein
VNTELRRPNMARNIIACGALIAALTLSTAAFAAGGAGSSVGAGAAGSMSGKGGGAAQTYRAPGRLAAPNTLGTGTGNGAIGTPGVNANNGLGAGTPGDGSTITPTLNNGRRSDGSCIQGGSSC